MKFFSFSITLLFLLVLCACGTVASTSTKPIVDQHRIEAGIEVYRSNYCGTCHTLTIANTHGTFGPNHDDLNETAVNYITLNTYTGTATNLADYIRESIVNPNAFSTPGFEASNHRMPTFTNLPQSDIDVLVYVLLNQGTE